MIGDGKLRSAGWRHALIILCEAAIWTPLWLTPFATRYFTSQYAPVREITVAISISLILAFATALLGRFVAPARLLALVFLSIGSLVAIGIALFHQDTATPTLMLSILQTNASETSEFVSQYVWTDWLLVGSLAIPFIALILQSRAALFWRPNYALLPLVIAIPVLDTVVHYSTIPVLNLSRRIQQFQNDFPAKVFPWSIYTPLKPYVQTAQAYRKASQIATLSQSSFDSVVTVSGLAVPKTFVVIIGESMSKAHMQLYGYDRPTTPALSALAAKGEIVAFNDVISTNAQTLDALRSALVTRIEGESTSVLDVLNKAGFNTYWLSNQQGVGLFTGVVALASLINSASEKHWVQKPDAAPRRKAELDEKVLPYDITGWRSPLEERRRSQFDDELLPILERVLEGAPQNKFIFVHLMGNHSVYRARFPASAEVFKDYRQKDCRSDAQNQLINDYDNSILFTDSIIGRVIDIVRRRNEESFVLYFSDHGQEVFDWRHYAHHGDAVLSPYLAEIPFLLWLSPSYRRNHSSFSDRLSALGDRKFAMDGFVHSVADLSRLSFKGLDLKQSVFSDKFIPRLRVSGEKDYDAFRQKWRPTKEHANGMRLVLCGVIPMPGLTKMQ